MPLIDNKLPMFLCKPLRFRQFLNFQAVRLPKLNALFDVKDSFATAVPNVRVNGRMFICVEEKSVASFSKIFGMKNSLLAGGA
jgi:hypothetical protein